MKTNISENLIGTNLELFGSDLEQKIKEASANCELVWTGININEISLYIWRIEKFNVVPVNQNTYGTFYEGDSYIILNIYRDVTNKLQYNVHFWLGCKTTQDEMGTAAYKTVELDTYLYGKAIQYRETQNNESDLFRSYFIQGITYNVDGIESGFKKVAANDYTNYQPLLYKIHNNGVNHLPLILSSVADDDAYILDCGLIVYVYKGETSTHKEKLLAMYTAYDIKEVRKGCVIVDIDYNKNNESNETYDIFLSQITKYSQEFNTTRKLFRINETDNKLSIIPCSEPITYQSFDTNDAFVFDTCHTTYIWVGYNSKYTELLNAWKVAFKITCPTNIISVVREGSEPEIFKMNLL